MTFIAVSNRIEWTQNRMGFHGKQANTYIDRYVYA